MRKLSAGQKILVDDGFPEALIISDEERVEGRRRTIPFKQQINRERILIMPALSNDEMAEARQRTKGSKEDVTGKHWDQHQGRWVPDSVGFSLPSNSVGNQETEEAPRPRVAKADGVAGIKALFQVREGTNLEKLLVALVARMGDGHAPLETLAKEVYGGASKTSALGGVIKGLQVKAASLGLPYGVEVTKDGVLLHET